MVGTHLFYLALLVLLCALSFPALWAYALVKTAGGRDAKFTVPRVQHISWIALYYTVAGQRFYLQAIANGEGDYGWTDNFLQSYRFAPTHQLSETLDKLFKKYPAIDWEAARIETELKVPWLLWLYRQYHNLCVAALLQFVKTPV